LRSYLYVSQQKYESAPRSFFYKSTQDGKVATAAVFPGPEETPSTVDAKPEPTTKTLATTSTLHVPEPDAVPAVEFSSGSQQTPSFAPAPSVGHLAHTQPPTSSPLRAMDDIQAYPKMLAPAPLAPATAQRTEDQQAPPIAAPVSFEVMVNFVFSTLVGSTGELQSAMLAALAAFDLGSGYEAPAETVFSMMNNVKNNLLPFSPKGLTGDQGRQMAWFTVIVDFWNAFWPHGYRVKEYPDDRVRTFLVEYRSIAGYLEIGLEDLVVNPPVPTPQPQPEQAPVQDPPKLVIHPPSPSKPLPLTNQHPPRTRWEAAQGSDEV
jgi:hypothetical protein